MIIVKELRVYRISRLASDAEMNVATERSDRAKLRLARRCIAYGLPTFSARGGGSALSRVHALGPASLYEGHDGFYTLRGLVPPRTSGSKGSVRVVPRAFPRRAFRVLFPL